VITKTEMFFDKANKYIFDAIIELHIRKIPVEAVLLRTELKRQNKLEAAGGPEYICSILDSVPSSANALYYAGIVRDRYNYRKLIETIEKMQETLAGIGDTNEQVVRIQELALGLRLEEDVAAHNFKDEVADSVMSMGDKRHLIQTGFRDIDRIIGGILVNEFVLIAGRPGMGKSLFIQQVINNIAKNGGKGIIFSLEMSAESIMQRSVCAMSMIDSKNWDFDVPQKEFDSAIESAYKLQNYNVSIYETVENARQMYDIIELSNRISPVTMIGVDNIQLMQTRPPIQKEYERLTIISRQLKKITQSLHIPVLCISHLNREVDKRDEHRPRLSDLRGSGSLEQDADKIIFIHREDQYRKQKDANMSQNDLDGIAEITIAKNRRGRTGVAKLVFREEYTLFADMAPEYLGTM
jgi:replicative DNA helicase